MIASTFPRGWAGVGLLILRVVVGVTAVVHGWMAAVGGSPPAIVWSTAAVAACAGILLVIGFATSLAAGVISIGTVGVALRWIPWNLLSPVDAGVSTVFVVSMGVAIALLGPGAISIDARRRGHREIVIPSEPSRTDSRGRKEMPK